MLGKSLENLQFEDSFLPLIGQVSATGGTVFWMSLGKQYWDKNTKRFNFL